MQTTTKVLLNTLVLYLKIVVNMVISLVSVPLILKALGANDYGIYNLVSGVVAMLAFLNSSMSISTQRFLSVAIGEGCKDKLNEIYSTGVFLHILTGVVIVAVFEVCGLFIFDGFLNIDTERIPAAKCIYQFLIISTFFTVLSVPYTAVINAKEDMLVFSIIGVVEATLKLLLAILLNHILYDRLVIYGLGIALITISSTLFYRLYVSYKYKELYGSFKYLRKNVLFEMLGFSGWNTFGAVAMIGRNQGVAIIINLFYGAIANAAYGIANQINGVLNYFSSTLQRAINPQLMQSEGMHNRERLINISFISSKYSVLILSILAIPIIIEMPYVLKLWLSDVPEYTLRFGQLVLILSIIFQYSMGLMSSIQAVGQIRNYFLIISVIILLNIPLCYLMMERGLPPYYCVVSFILLELISFVIRLSMASRLVGFKWMEFIRMVLLPSLCTIILSSIIGLLLHCLLEESIIRLLLVIIACVISFCFFAYKLCMSKSERMYAINVVRKLKCKVFQNSDK